MTTKKIRLGYVGCGMMAQKVHLPNLAAIDTCELVALAEVRPKLGKQVQESFRIPKLYRDHRELAADRDIDAVAVSGHYIGQGEIARDLLLAGKDVVMEKPMAVTVEQGERIREAERTSGKRLMVAYMKRYDAGNLAVKGLLDTWAKSGEMGKPSFVRNHGFGGDWTAGLDTPQLSTDEAYPDFQASWPSWLPEAMRGDYVGYLQQYTHNVNLMRFFLGEDKPVTIESVHLDGWRGVVVLKIGGVLATIESGWVDYEGWEEHTQIYFDKGWIRTEAPPLLLRNVPASVLVYRAEGAQKSSTSIFPEHGRTWSYKEEMRHFIDAVRDGTPLRSPSKDAIEDVRVLEAIYRKHVEVSAPKAAAAKR